MALLDLDKRLKGMDARIVHTMQDEIIVEFKAEIAEKVTSILDKCMTKPLRRTVRNNFVFFIHRSIELYFFQIISKTSLIL